MSRITGFLRSFTYASKGLVFVARGRNFVVMAGLGATAVGLGFALDIKRWEWTVVVLSIGVVLATEAMNSAIESLADAVHPERSDSIGRAKDAAAAASLLVSTSALSVGLIVFLKHLF